MVSVCLCLHENEITIKTFRSFVSDRLLSWPWMDAYKEVVVGIEAQMAIDVNSSASYKC